MPQVLHIDLISILPGATDEQRRRLIEAAAALTQLDEVVAAGVIQAEGADPDYDLACFFVLNDFTALEPFGTDPRYTRFLQGEVAPLLRGLAGADVSLDADFPAIAPHAACLALGAPDQTYDWEVRQALESWSEALSPASRVVGLAVGERQRYRGLVLAFNLTPLPAEKPQRRPFIATLVAGSARLILMRRRRLDSVPFPIVFIGLPLAILVFGALPWLITWNEGRRPPIEAVPVNLTLPPGTSLDNLEVATVLDIIDGDTIDVTVDGKFQRVRYFGIDTPERGDKCYREARDRTITLVGTKVLMLPDTRKQDPNGRELRYLFTPEGQSIDATLVAEGFATAWRADGRYRDQIVALEAQAKEANRGCLWKPQ